MKYILIISLLITSTLSAQLSRFSDRELFTMGKVWGLMKYYHPAVSQGKLDWDGVLLETFENKSKQNLNDITTQWLTTANQSKFDLIVKKDNGCDSITLRNFDSSWVGKLKNIQSQNKVQLSNLISQPKNVGSFYSNPVENSIRFSSSNEKVYDQFSVENKMLDLFRIWNAIEYFYPYKYLLDHQWDTVLK